MATLFLNVGPSPANGRGTFAIHIVHRARRNGFVSLIRRWPLDCRFGEEPSSPEHFRCWEPEAVVLGSDCTEGSLVTSSLNS